IKAVPPWISAGPIFQFNPAISLFVTCDSLEEIDALWQALIQGGTALMELGEYPFSTRFGWVQDRYGLTWQLALADGKQQPDKITPYLLFSGTARGKALEAARFYTDVFRASGLAKANGANDLAYQPESTPEGVHRFQLLGQPFLAMDHGFDADFTFNEAVSLIVSCDTQEEIDYFWQQLSHEPDAEACGWLKDRFGVSWQIVPAQLDNLLAGGTPEQKQRLTDAVLQMKKLDIKAIQNAYAGQQ
ncbi:MAG: VOC family protein, partial [Firmicutes bacterium]|nr:VOC family protein [Bacillota bacterium]